MQIKKKKNRFGSSIRNVSASCSHYYWIEWLAIILGAAMCLFYIIFDVNLHISFIFVSFAFCSIGENGFPIFFCTHNSLSWRCSTGPNHLLQFDSVFYDFHNNNNRIELNRLHFTFGSLFTIIIYLAKIKISICFFDSFE